MMRSKGLNSGQDLKRAGREQRRIVPRSKLGLLHQEPRNPLAILAEQNETRLPELVPLRIERMSASEFAFYRGTAAIMASDLGREADSGIFVAACGDAHVSNFGFYASPQRNLLFDLNDFDEAAWAPWEWDLKRLVTSVIVAGRSSQRELDVIMGAAREAIESYLKATRSIAKLDPLAHYFSHIDPSSAGRVLDRESKQVLRAALKDAQKRTGTRAARRLTTIDEAGIPRFRTSPPTMTRPGPEVERLLQEALQQYEASANIDVRMLLGQYKVQDIARRAVGVGSVGTRCFVTLLRDRVGNTMILQTKEAGRSVIEQYGGIAQPAIFNELVAANGQGARVVGLQRILQAYSDPFLGYIDRDVRSFYVRQFQDMKGGIDIESLADVPFATYARSCAVVLARAHGQSGRSAEIAGYAGASGKLTDSLMAWCLGYADRARGDFEKFVREAGHAGSGV